MWQQIMALGLADQRWLASPARFLRWWFGASRWLRFVCNSTCLQFDGFTAVRTRQTQEPLGAIDNSHSQR
jgi:hypothetical protein